MARRVAPALAVLAALGLAPAAEAKEYDLGFARLGMMVGQFKFAAWPAGQSVRCSDDPDAPKGMERLLSMPRQMVELGAVRCALFRQDDAGKVRPGTRKIGGVPVEIAATFAPDAAGTKRLVQLFLQGPREGYDGLVAHFTARLGKPSETGERFAGWADSTIEALVMHEYGDTVAAMVVDLRVQDGKRK